MAKTLRLRTLTCEGCGASVTVKVNGVGRDPNWLRKRNDVFTTHLTRDCLANPASEARRGMAGLPFASRVKLIEASAVNITQELRAEILGSDRTFGDRISGSRRAGR